MGSGNRKVGSGNRKVGSGNFSSILKKRTKLSVQ